MWPPFSVNITSVPNRSIAATACSPAWPVTVVAGSSGVVEMLIVMETASRRRWWRELAVLVALYAAYSVVRSALEASAQRAEDNARRIVSLERHIGLFHERSIQQFLDAAVVIRPLNAFYALAHFGVTIAVMLWLFLRGREYSRRRNAIVATTCLALVGYAVFPLMPPRLYADDGIVDTLAIHGAPWTYSR